MLKFVHMPQWYEFMQVRNSCPAAQGSLGRCKEVLVVTWRGPDARELHPNLANFFSFSKLLVVVSGPVSVDKLVSVENAPSTPLRDLDKYPRKLMVSGLMQK